MSRYCIGLGLLILTISTLIGCASRPVHTRVVYSPDTHLIFNPNWSEIATVDTPRSTWPITTTYQTPGEINRVRETTIDIQGRNGYNSDYTYRRFESRRSEYHR